MISKQREILPRLTEQITRENPGCGVLLSGSVKEGCERPTSDLDIFVVLPEDGEAISLDQKNRMDGITLDIAYMPANALRRDLSLTPHWFFPFSQAKSVHDPTGIAQQHQVIAREYFQKNVRVKQEWETQLDKVRRHKADKTFQLEFPTWESWARHMDEFVAKMDATKDN